MKHLEVLFYITIISIVIGVISTIIVGIVKIFKK
jgi:hypothetical protein